VINMRTLKLFVKLEDFEDEKLVGTYEIKELNAKQMLNFSRNFLEKYKIKTEAEVDSQAWNLALIIRCTTKDGKKLTDKFIENSPTKLYQALLIKVAELNALGREEESFLSRQS